MNAAAVCKFRRMLPKAQERYQTNTKVQAMRHAQSVMLAATVTVAC